VFGLCIKETFFRKCLDSGYCKSGLLVASRGHFAGITAAALLWNPVQGYLGSMSVCGAAQWEQLSESWPESNSTTSTLCYSTLLDINPVPVNNIDIHPAM
jgi:hypothetical protein